MRVTVLSPPSSEPLTVAELKAALRITESDEDSLLSDLITAARRWVEGASNRAIGLQTIRVDYPRWAREIELPRPPFRTLDSIQYLDSTEALQSLATSSFRVVESSDSQPALLELAQNVTLPIITASKAAVRITYKAGWDTAGSPGDVVPQTVLRAIIMVVGDLFEHREARMDIQTYDNPTARALLGDFKVFTL